MAVGGRAIAKSSQRNYFRTLLETFVVLYGIPSAQGGQTPKKRKKSSKQLFTKKKKKKLHPPAALFPPRSVQLNTFITSVQPVKDFFLLEPKKALQNCLHISFKNCLIMAPRTGLLTPVSEREKKTHLVSFFFLVCAQQLGTDIHFTVKKIKDQKTLSSQGKEKQRW